MSRMLPAGLSATVATPATSANLGPGFDSLGLALDWRDGATATVLPRGLEVEITGEGADTLPKDGANLVVKTLIETAAALGAELPGLRFSAHNTIPLARGLGSSSAAIAAGLTLAWGLVRPGEALDRDWAFQVGTRLEGHPDNIGPALYGGLTVGWRSPAGWRAKGCSTDATLRATTLVPRQALKTEEARGALPKSVPIADAIANSARTALLVEAVSGDLSLLWDATEDHLHQEYRRSLYPRSLALVDGLRSEGLAAVISGAGPTVAVLHSEAENALVDLTIDRLVSAGLGEGFDSSRHALGAGVDLL